MIRKFLVGAGDPARQRPKPEGAAVGARQVRVLGQDRLGSPDTQKPFASWARLLVGGLA
jgi:hypothetical protein